MAQRRYNQNTLVLGQWNAECNVCGFKFKSGDLQERWDGLMVCKDDWEQRHPSDFFRAREEDTSVPWNRTESAEAGGTSVSGGSFPPAENTTQTALGTQVDENNDGQVDGTFGLNNRTIG